ncbi:hypothetical protein AGLY_007704 [Aphis glycines]|uniref:Uncharacterized protein n=1 Tax=Aphis glycines TaxID=307491 RepID=A0A6G0TP12_APHGL|nr:hypothetical protein AGLY_007704 [Aphis glycines]
MFDVLHHVADVGRLDFALLYRSVEYVQQLDANVAQVFHVVHAELMVAESALFAHGHVARAAKVLERLVLVTRAEHYAVAHGGRYERVLRVVTIFERQTVQAVIFKTVHELVGHHAVCAQRLLTVVTVCHHVCVEILAAFAHSRKLVRVHLDRTVYGEVWQQSGYSAVCEDALLVTVGARDFFRLILKVCRQGSTRGFEKISWHNWHLRGPVLLLVPLPPVDTPEPLLSESVGEWLDDNDLL